MPVVLKKDIEKMDLNEVVIALLEADPKLEKNLKKLLKIAIEKPSQYNSFSNMLNMFY